MLNILSVYILKNRINFELIIRNHYRRSLFIILLFVSFSYSSLSQHDSLHIHQSQDTIEKNEIYMHSFFSQNFPMNRDGSGTGWQADQSPMWMFMKMKKKTALMFHGSLFLRYTIQDLTNQSNRGGQQFDAPNMFMFSASREMTKKDLFSFFTMISLEPLSEGNSGYPLLFQNGETYNGVALVDRQHPHDFISTLAINWTHSVSKELDVNYYLAFPGEPSLGPEFFMHRLSAMNNPDAPLGHHWQDATHISFGVATLGIRYKFIKFEGSAFNGREPDEKRFNFDGPQADSYSYRVSVNPISTISFQFSQGFLQSPEILHPTENIIRTTSSIIHTKKLSGYNFISSAAIWGMNTTKDYNYNSFLLESNLQVGSSSIYTRYELIQKSAEDLSLVHFKTDDVFLIQAFTLGYNRILLQYSKGLISIGAQATLNIPDPAIEYLYGSCPLSAQVFLKFSPPRIISGHHH